MLRRLFHTTRDWLTSPDPARRRVLDWSRRAFIAGMLALLAWRMSQFGWGEILNGLPTSPWFYLTFVGLYLLVPVANLWGYRMSWRFPAWSSLPVFIKAQVYNEEVVDYGGAVFMHCWATQHQKIDSKSAFHVVKDNAIISALCGYAFAAALPVALYACGQFAPGRTIQPAVQTSLLAAPFIVAGLVVIPWLFRRKIFSLVDGPLFAVTAIHAVRLSLATALLTFQWHSALPDEPLGVFLTIMAAQNVVGRIPWLPGRDISTLMAAVSVSERVQANVAGIGAMLITAMVLQRATNFLLYAIFSRGMWAPTAKAADTTASVITSSPRDAARTTEPAIEPPLRAAA